MLVTIQSPYWSTIGRQGVLRLGGWTPHVQSGFHGTESTLGLHTTGATGLSPSLVRLSSRLTPYDVLSAFARRYLRSRGCFPFLRVLRCFSSPGSPPAPMHSGQGDPQRAGFPHSDILGSQLASNSPRLFAGSHVFHRLLTPRHPPYALGGLFMLTGRRRRSLFPALLRPHPTITPPGCNVCVFRLRQITRYRLASLRDRAQRARPPRLAKTTITCIRLSKIVAWDAAGCSHQPAFSASPSLKGERQVYS